jgi:dipeptidyl-peptidase III
MRQVSAEAIEIFDFIIELYNCCSGEWGQLGEQVGLQPSDVEEFLTYAATFLSNMYTHHGILFRVLDHPH